MKIYSRWDGPTVLFENDSTGMRETVLAAIAGGADLSGAYLSRANLSRANLSGVNLRRANLSEIRADLWDVLLRAPNEIAGLLAALREGRVDGSVYEGECACLVGTIANVAHKHYTSLELLTPNGARAAERWFLAIRKGDTPEKSPITKITVEWIEDFETLLERAAAFRSLKSEASDVHPE